MNTLIEVCFRGDLLTLRTISRKHKSNRFVLTQEEIVSFLRNGRLIAKDLYSFAELKQKEKRVEVRFSWLDMKANQLSGRDEFVVLPEEFIYLAREFATGWRDENETRRLYLSTDQANYVHIRFNSRRNLHNVTQDKVLRNKLANFLKNNFKWPSRGPNHEIAIFDDVGPYFFGFEERLNGRPGICGGIILHNPDGDLKRSYYCLHT